MDKKKKGMLLIITSLVIITITIFSLRDSSDMAEVEKAQDADIEKTAAETLNEENDLFGEVEEAQLALDTTKAEKH